MTQTVSRMFASQDEASRAVTKLKETGFKNVHLFSSAGSHDQIVETLKNAYVLEAQAKAFAKGIAGGNTLVSVHAPWGQAGKAIKVFKNFSTVDSGYVERPEKSRAWDERVPMSSILQIPTLAKPKRRSAYAVTPPKTIFGKTELSKKSAPFSSAIGWSTLSTSKTPLSSKLGMKTLSQPKSKANKP